MKWRDGILRFLCVACMATVLTVTVQGPAYTEEPEDSGNILEQIFVFDDGEGNAHLQNAEVLMITAQNTADRAEMVRLMYRAIEEIIVGISEVLPYDPDNEQALRLQRSLFDTGEIGLEQLSEGDRVRYDTLLAASESGDCETTQKIANELLSSIPDLNYVRIILGDCHFHNGDWKSALNHYRAAAEKDPDYARAYTRMAECYTNMGDEKEALSHYIKAVILDPGSDALVRSLKTYAYQHTYKVLLDRVSRIARIIITPEGELKVAVTTHDMPQASFNAWAAFGLKKYILYRDHFVQHPGEPLEPSFDMEKQSISALLEIYGEMKSEDPNIRDADIEFLLHLKGEGLLDAFVYTRYFRPEFADSYALWRKTHEKEIQTLFEKYLVVIDPYQVKFYKAKDLIAGSRFEEAFELFRECAEGFINGRDPEIKRLLAESLTYMGRCARILGRTEDALQYHQAALEFMQEVRYQEGEAKVLNSLALTLMVLGRYEEALESYKKSLLISKNRRDKDAEISALTNMGEFYLSRGELDKAATFLNTALEESEHNGMENGLGTIYTNLGCVASGQGDFKRAMECYEKGLAIARSGKDINLATTVLSNMGTLLMDMGQLSDARTRFEEALTLSREVKNKQTEATLLGNLGGLANKMGDIPASLDLLAAAYGINMEIRNRHGEAMNLLNLGGLSMDCNDTTTALEYWNKALAIGRELKARDIAAASLHNIATAIDDEEKGLSLIQDAIMLFSAKDISPSESNPYPTPAREDLLITDDSVRALFSNRGFLFARLAERFRNKGEVAREREYLHYAFDSLRLSIEILEGMRKGIDQEKTKIMFLAGRLWPYEDIIRVSLRLADLEKGKGWMEKAFYYSESSKSRALVDLLNESRVKRFAGMPDEEILQEKEFEMTIGALETSVIKEPDEERLRDLYRKMDGVKDAYREFRRALQEKYPIYASIKYPEALTIAEVQEILDPGTGFVEFFVGNDFIIYWVLTRNNAAVYRVSDTSGVYERIDLYREMITDWRRALRVNAGADAESYAEGMKLYTMLMSDGLKALGAIDRLIIVPDGKLYSLPFQTLITDIKEQRPCYLGEKHAISYVQSASVLAFIKKHPRKDTPPNKLFAMGRPIYGWKEVEENEIRPTHKEIVKLAKRGNSEDVISELGYYLGKEVLVDLPLTENEVQTIGETLGEREYIFIKEKATEDRVKEYSRNGLLKKFRYIHFAAHGLMSDEAPSLCAVALTQDKDEVEDGFLTLGEVYGLELESELVTLSACKLGLGRPVVGEGVIGLTRAFMFAGAQSVVVSLWSVADQATMMLMTRFYTNLNRGMNKDRAMQKAQCDLMKESFSAGSGASYSLAHPFFWAPFIIFGMAE